MTSEDWKIVLLALIATGGPITATALLIFLEILRRKLNVANVKADTAATAAVDAKHEAVAAKNEAANTKSLINGRIDQLLEVTRSHAFDAGKAEALKQVAAESIKQKPVA